MELGFELLTAARTVGDLSFLTEMFQRCLRASTRLIIFVIDFQGIVASEIDSILLLGNLIVEQSHLSAFVFLFTTISSLKVLEGSCVDKTTCDDLNGSELVKVSGLVWKEGGFYLRGFKPLQATASKFG